MSDDQIYPVENLTIEGSAKEQLSSEQFQQSSKDWMERVGAGVSDDTVELTMSAVIRNGPFETQYHQFNGENGKTNQATVNTSEVTITTNSKDNISIFKTLADTVGNGWSEIEDEELSNKPILSFDKDDGLIAYIPRPDPDPTLDESEDGTDNEETDNEND